MMSRRFPVLAFLGALAAACSAAGVSCYQMNVRTTHLGAIQSVSTCDDFLHQQLTGLGYHAVQRVANTYAMFSKDAALAWQTPTSFTAPGTVGGLIGAFAWRLATTKAAWRNLCLSPMTAWRRPPTAPSFAAN
jgi:hypothetical protein